MAQLPAYAVDGGKVPAAMLRRVLYAATNGENGVVAPPDLKVRALSIPGLAVQIARGGALCRMRTQGANAFETYLLAQDSASTLEIPGTTGSARTDYVIARIDDWHFTGAEPPVDPLNALYWSFARVSSLNGIPYPYVPLAKITIPANSTVITNAMIEDLRRVAIPRRETRVLAVPNHLPAQDVPGPGNGYFTVAETTVSIPEWATRAEVSATFSGIALRSNSATGWASPVLAGTATGMQTRVDENWTGNWHRFTVVGGGPIPIGESYRGTTAAFRWRMMQDGGSGRFHIDSGATFLASIEFQEVAE